MSNARAARDGDDSSQGGRGRQERGGPRRRTAQLAFAAGVLDEIELHVIPVLFGQGRRLSEGLAPEQIELERTRILEGENGVTHMHYRVRRWRSVFPVFSFQANGGVSGAYPSLSPRGVAKRRATGARASALGAALA